MPFLVASETSRGTVVSLRPAPEVVLKDDHGAVREPESIRSLERRLLGLVRS
jgi:hypothetical protein